MGDGFAFRLQAMKAIDLAERVNDLGQSMHYLNIAASYIALDRLHLDRDESPTSQEVPRSKRD